MDDKIVGYLIFGAIIIVISLLVIDERITPFSDTISIYTVKKECDDINGYKNCKLKLKSGYHYKVFPENQVVIKWEINDEGPVEKLENCAVKNKRNWNCSQNYFSEGFRNGNWIHENTENTFYLTRAELWLLMAKGN